MISSLLLLCSILLLRERSLANKPSPVLPVFRVLKSCVEADVKRGQVLFNSLFPCGAGPPLWPLP